jgi:crossover junction endodeoxyribonuclease RuvC
MERGENMVILGIDPGLAIVGWGVLDYDKNRFRPLAYGSINTPAGMETADRLARIHHDLSAIIDHYRPTEMAVEELFFTKNITTGIRVAEARGVILMTGREKGLTLAEYTPMQVKQAVVGYGLAEKNQVMDMTRRLLKLKAIPKPDDAADALAIAICHARSATSLLRRQDPNVKQTV